MSLPEFLLSTILQPYYFEIFYTINKSPRLYKYLIYYIQKIQSFQKEIEIGTQFPEKSIPTLKRMLITFLEDNNIYFTNINGNNAMLVANDEKLENYIRTKNHDLVYNCQISEEDLVNPLLFDEMLDYHYITYLNDKQEFTKYDNNLSCNNSELFTFNKSYTSKISNEETNIKKQINIYINRTEIVLNGMILEKKVDTNIEQNFNGINFTKRPNIIFYLLDEEKINDVLFYHKLIDNNNISQIFIKAEKLKTKYPTDKPLVKKLLKEFENQIKENLVEPIKKIEKINSKSNDNKITDEIDIVDFIKFLNEFNSFLVTNSIIVTPYLNNKIFKKICSFRLLTEFINKFEYTDKKEIENINIYLNSYKIFKKINIDDYFQNNQLIPQKFYPAYGILDKILKESNDIKRDFNILKESMFKLFSKIREIIFKGDTSPLQLKELINKKRYILSEYEYIKKMYYKNLIEVNDIILSNLPDELDKFNKNLKRNNENKEEKVFLEVLSKQYDEPENWELFISEIKNIINDNNNIQKYSKDQFDKIDIIYKDKIKYIEKLIEGAKKEKTMLMLKQNLNPFNESNENKYRRIINNDIFKQFIWDELLTYQIRYLMRIKYDKFCSFFGYNELDNILCNENKFIGELTNFKRLFLFEISNNIINEVINGENSICFKANSITFFEIKTSLSKEIDYDFKKDLDSLYKNSIILTFIKNSLRFRNAFIDGKIINGNENINLILIVNSKVNYIQNYYSIFKDKINFYLNNKKNENINFSLYVYHIDASAPSDKIIDDNNGQKAFQNEICAKNDKTFKINKLSIFIFFILIIFIFFIFYKYNYMK